MLLKGFSKTRIVFLLILCILIFTPNPAAGVIAASDELTRFVSSALTRGNEWFVTTAGTGTDCSRINPGPLEYCVETKANVNDTVYVGAGSYISADLDDNLLFIQKSLRLVGSCIWDATGPVVCYPQNEPPYSNSSILHGEGVRRIIAIVGPGISVSIENFLFYNGNADQVEPKPASVIGAGGGVYAYDLDALVLKNNYIWSNRASDTGTSICDTGEGGGVYAADVQNLKIFENTIIFNSASSPVSTGRGGGAYITSCGSGGEVTIRSNRFHENLVGGTTSSVGAGAYLSYIRNLDLSNNIFEYHNSVIRHDWIQGSALVLGLGVRSKRIDHNLFHRNYGSTIVEVWGLTGGLTRNTFWDNDASYDLHIQNTNDINIINNFFGKTFGRSTAAPDELQGTRGGVSVSIYIGRGGCGGGIPVVDLINNTFALAPYAVQVDEWADVDIVRNIFTNHNFKAIDVNPANTRVSVKGNLFWGNALNGKTGTTFWVADPKLVNMSNGDFHLKKGSAAIDKVPLGAVTSDIDYQLRPIGSGVDLGADEYGSTIFFPVIKR